MERACIFLSRMLPLGQHTYTIYCFWILDAKVAPPPHATWYVRRVSLPPALKALTCRLGAPAHPWNERAFSYPGRFRLGEGSHFFPKFGHFFPKTSYVHIYVIRLHTTLMQAFSSHTARASYRKKNHNIIIQTHTHNIHACCIWIHTRCSHHTTSFTACIINPSCIIESMSHNDII